MSAKQRVLAAVAGQPVDRVPAGFWFHFPAEQHHGEAAVQAHADLLRETGVDMLKIMTENLVPHDIPIRTASDWKSLRPFRRDSRFITEQADIIKRVLERIGDGLAVLTTVHGAVASLWHAYTGPDGFEENRWTLGDFLRADPDAFTYALDIVTEAQVYMVEAMRETGVDGIYYAALGGEKKLFTSEEFERYIRPRDLTVLRAAEGMRCNVLHLCKDGLDLGRFAGYPADVVNWGVFENNPGLEEGMEIFPDKAILGGLDDRAGAMADGPDEAVERDALAVLARMKGKRFLLGADCTLPTEIPLSHIRAAVGATRKFAGIGE